MTADTTRVDPTAWNWGGKTAFFWAGFDALCIVWIYYRLPDPTGMTFGEIDRVRHIRDCKWDRRLTLFHQRFELKIPARKFRSVDVDEFEGERRQLDAAQHAEQHIAA